MAINPAIIVSAYNRPAALQRLLQSLSNAKYPDGNVTLVISIDHGPFAEVRETAVAFEWQYGEKKIIEREQHLGLKAHILACGDMSVEYGAVVLLEDDLMVSPNFYEYAVQAHAAYSSDEAVAGISLYSYRLSENGFRPFEAIDDGTDVYFMQVASSWGQLWNARQWRSFRDWFKTHPDLTKTYLPAYLHEWGEHSWKKHFIHYLVDCDKYFVFPRFSFSTNFEEPGTNSDSSGRFQVPLQLYYKACQFGSLQKSGAVYDAWFELLPRCLNKLNAALAAYNYTVDLYGTKDRKLLKTDYILCCESGEGALLEFSTQLLPVESNILLNLKGGSIGLFALTSALKERSSISVARQKASPGISIVIPVVSFSAVELDATLRSLALQRLDAECIIVYNKEQCSVLENLQHTYALRIKIISATHPLSATALIFLGLKSADRELVTWVRPGTIFSAGNLSKVVTVFRDYAHVVWLRGVDEKCSNGEEYSQVRTAKYRLTKAEVYRRLKQNTLETDTQLHIFRKSCLLNCLPADDSEITFFFNLMSRYDQHVAVMKLGESLPEVKHAINKDLRKRLLTKHAGFKRGIRKSSRLVNFLLKTPPFNDGSWQWYLHTLGNFPDVLRYDESNSTFYLCKF